MYDHQSILNEIKFYKQRLKDNEQKQREMRRNLTCMDIPYNKFKVSGSLQEGNAMFEGVAKLALSAFDDTCKNVINGLTLGNLHTAEDKIEKRYDEINANIAPFNVSIKIDYYTLKMCQCDYTFELLFHQSRYKEIEKAEKEIIKEQLKEERELEREKEKYERERNNLQYKFNKLIEQGKVDADLQAKIDEATNIIEHNQYMLSHKRCGYVYVVSNDDMKEGQYKIGITRRTVEERMKELGSGASHSFPMNVHGYVYCEDCFQVESAMHKYFAGSRVNQVNSKKEWFKTTLPEIKKAFKEVCNIDIELVEATNDNYLYSKEKVNI